LFYLSQQSTFNTIS
jgi:hypothetical protein